MPVQDPDVVTLTHTAVNVTTSSASALAANTERDYLLLVNDSDQVIYIKFGGAAVLNQGIRLAASGGAFEASHKFGNLSRAAVFAIHGGSGNKALLITEG